MAQSFSNRWKFEPEYIDLLNFFIEKTADAKSPMSMKQLVREFKEKSGAPQTVDCLYMRSYKLRTRIYSFEHIDTNTKVKLMFALQAPVNGKFLKELKKSALVEVDHKNRFTKYEANDRSLQLNRDQNRPAKIRTPRAESKQSNRWLINNYFEKKNNADAGPENEGEKEMGNLIKFITEMCENVDTPLNILKLTRDFNKLFGISRSILCIQTRIASYCREIQKTQYLDTHSKVKQLFGLSETVDSNFLNELRQDAVVEVDNLNRITKYKANDGRLVLNGDPSQSAKKSIDWVGRKKSKTTVEKQCDSGGDEEKEKENDHPEDDIEFDLDEENDHLDETEDHFEPSNRAIEFDDETPAKNQSEMSIDNDFDYEVPTGRSHGSEMDDNFSYDDPPTVKVKPFRGLLLFPNEFEADPDIQQIPKPRPQIMEASGKTSSCTLQTPKRKADASAGSSTSKRTKGPSDESMDYNLPRFELNPFRGILGLPNEIEKDADIQEIPKPLLDVIEVPIKEEYAEEAQSSLKMVLKSFKSLILGLDTTGLSKLQVKLDTKIEKTGRGVEVSNKEVIMAMELLIVKLSKHGALKSSEDSISLRDMLLMLHTIILNSSFKGLEGILKTLKKNIKLLKVLDKIVPVSKVDSALRATLDSIST